MSEDELTAEFADTFGPTYNAETVLGIGDDCALFQASAKSQDQRVLVSTDVLVENVHFKTQWSSPEVIAQRAFAQNLADIAASGGRGTGLVCALVLPSTMPDDQVLDFSARFSSSLAEIAKEQGVAVLGGDLSRGSEIVVSITIFGTLDGREQVSRAGAKPGDIVAVAGHLGLSAQGLELLESAGISARDDQRVKVYLCPDPPYSAGIQASRAGAHAMMDISDGLLKDAARIAKASGVSIYLAPSTEQKSAPDEYYYYGGEDHALLAVFPPAVEIPSTFEVIGIVQERSAERITGPDLKHLKGQVWDHFT